MIGRANSSVRQVADVLVDQLEEETIRKSGLKKLRQNAIGIYANYGDVSKLYKFVIAYAAIGVIVSLFGLIWAGFHPTYEVHWLTVLLLVFLFIVVSPVLDLLAIWSSETYLEAAKLGALDTSKNALSVSVLKTMTEFDDQFDQLIPSKSEMNSLEKQIKSVKRALLIKGLKLRALSFLGA